MTTTTSPPPRTALRRQKDRAGDRAALADALNAGMFCHLGVVLDGAPIVLPTAYGVDLERNVLYLHGSVAARSLRAAPEGTICVTVTHADGLVLARSAFHHSVNYRSVVVFGTPRVLDDPDEKRRGLDRIVEHLVPGRTAAVRAPTRKELAATVVLELSLDEASVKVRTGAADDEPEDLDLPVWTGVIPLSTRADAPITNDDCDLDVPEHVTARATALSARPLARRSSQVPGAQERREET